MSIQTTRRTKRFSDFYMDMDVHPIRGDLYLHEDVEAVKSSIRNIVFTGQQERFFNPGFGANIIHSLFENISADTEYVIRTRIINAIENFEYRANIIEVRVTAMPDDNQYHVSIVFSVINNPNPQQLDLILDRVR